MIEASDIIALVEYTSSGDFQARAKPLTIYKGELDTEEIWVSGFSNRYGPIDTMQAGDRYIVFLRRHEPTEGVIERMAKRINEEPELAAYLEALKTKKAYYVWTPTSGDLKVSGKKVQYDLMQTSYYSDQSFYPIKEFENFLKATSGVRQRGFHKQVLKRIKASPQGEQVAQHLMMLYLSSYQSFNSIFQVIADEQKPEPCYALAKLVGQVEGEESRNILVQLLSHDNSIVQGEAVRQLADEDPKFIGPLFLSHLTEADDEGIYPSTIMDPVRNQIDGGKIEIIKTLGRLKYKPAEEQLLPLLETEDKYLFELIVNVLIELDSKDFVPYINKHLESKTKSLIFEICQIIVQNNLNECKPSLMEFISSHNRNDHPDYAYAISSHMGLAHFDDEITTDFLIKDFQNLLSNNDSIESGKLNSWIREYIRAFTDLNIAKARPLVYESLFKWAGYNYDFGQHPELFHIKESLEDSISQEATKILEGHSVEKVKTIVFVTNTQDYNNDFKPEYDQIILIKLDYENLNLASSNDIWPKLKEVKEKLSAELDLPISKISSRSGSFVSNLDNRFESSIDFSPMSRFYKYALALPNEHDLDFLKALAESNFAKKEFDKRQLNKTIQAIQEKLDK